MKVTVDDVVDGEYHMIKTEKGNRVKALGLVELHGHVDATLTLHEYKNNEIFPNVYG